MAKFVDCSYYPCWEAHSPYSEWSRTRNKKKAKRRHSSHHMVRVWRIKLVSGANHPLIHNGKKGK